MRFHKDVLVNGSNPLLLLDELRTLGDCRVAVDVEATPPLDQMDPTACYFTWNVLLETAHPKSEIEDVFIFVAGDMELSIEEGAAPPAAASRPVRRRGRRAAARRRPAGGGGRSEERAPRNRRPSAFRPSGSTS